MVHPGEVLIAFGAFTAIAFSVKAIATAAVRYQETKLKYSGQPSVSLSDARIERMEQAIDAIAIEIERISENQRFTTRLLAKREDRAISRG